MKKNEQTIDTYIQSFPAHVQVKLQKLRDIIKQCDPDVEEKIAWGVPTFYDHGYLLQIAAYQTYIGFYTNPEALQHFEKRLAPYKTNHKNTTHLPLDVDIDETLIKDMVMYCVQMNRKKSKR